MASLNKVFLLGNLTRDPDLRYTPSGAAVCEFGIAVSRRFSANGAEQDEVCFVDIVVWSKQAENCKQYLSKGSPALIEGRLQFDQWEDRNGGGKRSRLRVLAERVQFVGSPRRNDNPEGDNSYNGAPYGNNNSYGANNGNAPRGNYNGNYNNNYNNNANSNYSRPAAPPMPPMPEEAFNPSDGIDDIVPF